MPCKARSELCAVDTVDDFERFRKFALLTLKVLSDVEVVGQASTGFEALKAAQFLQPDVILLDICLPDINGYEVAESIRRVSPYSRIIFVTAEASHAVAIAALAAGAMGFVTKQNASNDLIYAIREVMQGRKFLSQNLT